MRQETRRWRAKSREDLKTAEILIENDRLPEGAFFLQQSIEKALKSVIIEQEGDFPRIHDLVALGRRAGIPDDLLETCKQISPAYTYARYPDVIENSGLGDKIEGFLKRTKEVLDWAEGIA